MTQAQLATDPVNTVQTVNPDDLLMGFRVSKMAAGGSATSPYNIKALAFAGGTGGSGAGVKSITLTQGPVVAGQPSTVTMVTTLTDGTELEAVTFESPAGADGLSAYQVAQASGFTGTQAEWLLSLVGATGPAGATGSAGADGASAYQVAVTNGYTGTQAEWLASLKGATGDTGATGATGQAGAQGVGVKEITLTQGAVTAGEQSTVTMATTLSDGTETTSQTFDVPAGAAGSDATVTTANIEAALGYAPADPSKFLALSPTSSDELQNIIAPSDSKFGSSYAFGVEDDSGNILQVGCVSSYGYKWFSIKSTDGSPGIQIVDSEGNGTSNGLTLHLSTDGAEIVSSALGINAEYGGSFRFVNKDDKKYYWQMLPASGLSSGNSALNIVAGTTDGSAWQSALVSLNPTTNTAEFLNEPVTTTTYTFATLPASPVSWQRALVTDKAIGSGAQGVMAMWNPNTKAWTGLGGETLV